MRRYLPFLLLLALPGQDPDEAPRFRAGDPVFFHNADPRLRAYVAELEFRADKPFRVEYAVVPSLKHFREFDAYFGFPPKQGHATTLPSGGAILYVDDMTAAVVLRVQEPDGVRCDTPAVLVRVTSGELRGRDVWTRYRKLIPDDARRPKPTRREVLAAAGLYRQGVALEAQDKHPDALRAYLECLRLAPLGSYAEPCRERITRMAATVG